MLVHFRLYVSIKTEVFDTAVLIFGVPQGSDFVLVFLPSVIHYINISCCFDTDDMKLFPVNQF